MKKPLVLMILDGFGIAPVEGNAIAAANKPNLDKIFAENPHTQIGASGMDVGLPDGQMGNSEVGHTNIGAGRIVYQELTRITKSAQDGDMDKNEALLKAMENAKNNGKALHLMGLLSDGGVHSHNTHLYALLEMAKRMGVEKVFVHCFMDGRDVPPSSGKDYVEELHGQAGGNRRGQDCHRHGPLLRHGPGQPLGACGKGLCRHGLRRGRAGATAPCAPCRIPTTRKSPTSSWCPRSAQGRRAHQRRATRVIFYNFRPDRAREITRTLVDPDFTGFERKKGFFPL